MLNPELSAIIKKTLINKKINYSPHGSVLIKDVNISGQGNDHMIVEIKFKTKYGLLNYKGHLFFTFLPQYDATNKILYANDISFDPNTQQALRNKGAAWLINEIFTNFLNSQIKLPIKSKLDNISAKLQTALNRPIGDHQQIAGTVTHLNMIGILPNPTYLQVRTQAIGTASLRLY